MKPRASGPSPRALGATLFAIVFISNAWFHNGYGWNQTARLDPIWAFVEPGPNQGTLRIDDFLPDPERGINTGDWAHNPEFSEHYYSNKAPGVTLMGIPCYWLIYHLERLAGIDPVSIASVLVNSYLINLFVTVLPVAVSALFFFRLVRHLGRSDEEALWLTLLLYAGTLMLPFSTMLWAHTTAAAFVVMSLACFVLGGRRRAFIAGLLAGAAVLTDYGAAPFAVSIVIAAAVVPARRADARAIVLGGLAPVLIFATYHLALFGSPFRLATSNTIEGILHAGDVLGMFGYPSWKALWGLTFSSVRGIFFSMPVLLVGLLAFRGLRRGAEVDTGHRAFLGLALANVVAVLLLNMSYNTWQGGVSAGARFQIVALPFYIALLALVPKRRWMPHAVIGLGAISVANMFVIASVSPMAQDALHGSPFFFTWAKFLGVMKVDLGLAAAPPLGGPLSRGSLHVYPTFLLRDWSITLMDPLIARYASFNLGERLLGLQGVWSLVPLGVIEGALAGMAMRLVRRPQA